MDMVDDLILIKNSLWFFNGWIHRMIIYNFWTLFKTLLIIDCMHKMQEYIVELARQILKP